MALKNKGKNRSNTAVKALQQKNARRRWLTYMRMFRYGVNNITRNAWLTIAASAVMTITLLVIFTAVAARTVLMDTAEEIKDRVNMSVYLQTDTTDEEAAAIEDKLEQLESVKSVTYISPAEAKAQFAEDNKGDADMLSALNEATNAFPGTLRVKIVDINDPSELRNFVRDNELVQEHIHPDRAPSFESDRSNAIGSIGRWVVFAERFGIGAAILFIAISSLIIFNTIRMAIFNRKDEIQMMKLIGADRSFIRGPFIVEAVFYGLMAAIIATVVGIVVLYYSRDSLQSYGIQVETVVRFVTDYAVVTLIGMIIIGALIGVTSSLFATRRYLKI
jgi:cell division transport system permease protein